MNFLSQTITAGSLLLCFVNVLSAQNAVTLNFSAPGVTHITYGGSASGQPGEIAEIQLVRIDPAENVEILDQATGPSVSISGTRQDTGLGIGTYQYLVRSRSMENGEWSEWQTRSSRTFEMTADKAQGTLLFDETLGAVLIPSFTLLTVPENRKLTLNGRTATELSGTQLASTTNLIAHGELTFGTSFSASNTHFVIATPVPVTISGINASLGRFTLKEGGTVQNVEGGTFVFEKNGRAQDTIGATLIFQQGGDVLDSFGGSATFHDAGTAISCKNMGIFIHSASSLDVMSSTNVIVGVGADSIATITDGTLHNLGLSTNGTTTRAILDKVTVTGDVVLRGGTVEVISDVAFDGSVTLYEQMQQFKPANTKFRNVVLWEVSGEKVEFTDCLFADEVHVYGGSPIFTGCEFGKLVEFYGQNEAVFTGSLFLDAIQIVNGWIPEWSAPFEKTPVISGNAFMGPIALKKRVLGDWWNVNEPLVIGPNYYGHKDGFIISDQPEASGFLQHKQHAGARINQGNLNPSFAPAEALTASPVASSRRDQRVLPSFWINGMVYGQSTIEHESGMSAVNIRGRDSLLSVHLVSSDNHIRGARLYVQWDDKTVETVRRDGLPVHRDMDLYRKTYVEIGGVTFDFVLPGVDSGSQTGLIWLDLSGVQGYETEAYPTGHSLIGTFNINFDPPPERPLRIAVVPVEITGLFSSWGTGNAAGVIEQLNKIPDMLPLPSSHLQIDLMPVHRERSPSGAFQLAGIGTLNWLTSRFAANRGMKSRSRYFRDTAPDFYVLVLPQSFVTGYFSGIWERLDTSMDGVMFNSLWRNRIVLVAEHKPAAVLHELGHCVGLNLGSSRNEQYNQHPPAGLPIQAASIRAIESNIPSLHLARPTGFWFGGFSYYDIMGNADTIWARSQTIQQFHQWFQENLQAPSETYAMMATSATKNDMTTQSESTHRILLSAIAVGNTLEFVSLREVSIHEMDALPAPEGYSIGLSARNAQGIVVYETTFRALEDGIFLATFDLPADAVSIRIYDEDNPEWTYFISEAAGLISTAFTKPLPAESVADVLEMEWAYVAAASASNAVIQHSVYFRPTPADHWQTIVLETDATNLTVNASFLPANATPELLLVTSDGISQVSNTVTIATSAHQPQPPQITILSPVNGDVGDTNAFWVLMATSMEPSGTPTTDTGEWISSLDGPLGSGRRLGTSLSVGTHALTYSSTAANGLVATATVSVVVHEMVTALDLSLDEDSLYFVNEKIDPTGLTPAFLWPGVTNTFFLQVRNQGVDATVRASLQITPQGRNAVALGTIDLAMVPFESRIVQFTYMPDPDGMHVVRAQIELLGMSDPVASNNVIEKTYYSPVGITASADPPEGGTVSGHGLYGYGAQATVRAFPENNYFLAAWRENNETVSTNAVYTFTTETRRTLVAVFEQESTGGLFAGGTGTPADPFLVATAAHLNNVRMFATSTFRQTADISLLAFQSGIGWEPVVCVDFGDPFAGNYDGAGYKITDLVLNTSESFAGLFGWVSGARLENIVIENANVTGNFVAGILAGSAGQSTILNCRVSGELRGRTPGGLVGTLTDTVVQNCHTDVSVRGVTQPTVLGGISATMNRGRMEDSSSQGWINPEYNQLTSAIGGLVGKLSGTGDVRIERSWSFVNITNGYQNVGGLVGEQESGLIVDCFARGSIHSGAYSLSNVGGIAGHFKSGVISNCFATGLVDAGFSAQNEGGLIGRYTAGQIHTSYFDRITTGQANNGYGLSRTTAEMTYPYDAETYTGWDFTTVWKEDTGGTVNGGYPHLGQNVEEPTTPNGIAISWLVEHDLPTDGSADLLDPHNKRMTLVDQFIADTNPHDPGDVFKIQQAGMENGQAIVRFKSSARRQYTLLGNAGLDQEGWTGIPGCGPRSGIGGDDVMHDTSPLPAARFYRLKVELSDP